jgi:hypothetical protein
MTDIGNYPDYPDYQPPDPPIDEQRLEQIVVTLEEICGSLVQLVEVVEVARQEMGWN